jgi:hypothetical protein
LVATLAAIAFVISVRAQSAAGAPNCKGIDARLLISPTAFNAGRQPAFTIVLKNASTEAVRLLDVRDGRRPDLAQTYYEILFEQDNQPLNNLRRVIADPGPVSSADFFMLRPGTAAKTELTTPVDLKTLPVGNYSARVRITFDPLGGRVPPCYSAKSTFKVTK